MNNMKNYQVPFSVLLLLSTFNVRGLSKVEKQHQLDQDCTCYKVDIVALQVTKITSSFESTLPNKNRLLIFDQTDGHQRRSTWYRFCY